MGANGSKHRENLELEVCDNEIHINLNVSLCNKNPNHKDFIAVRELSLHHLPEELRHEKVIEWLQLEIERTVKVTVNETSTERPPSDIFYSFAGTKLSRKATGRAWLHGEEGETMPCPIKDCKYNNLLGPNHSVYGYVYISTNKHVVFDDFEASNTEVEFFYDTDDDRRDLVTVYGISVSYDIDHEDQSFICCVYHEQDLPEHIRTEYVWGCLGTIPTSIRKSMKRHVFVISHPHGMPKKITVGDLVDRYRPWERPGVLWGFLEKIFRYLTNRDKGCVTRYTASTCPGSSGAPVLVCLDERFCWPLTHSSHDGSRGLNSSYTYFK